MSPWLPALGKQACWSFSGVSLRVSHYYLNHWSSTDETIGNENLKKMKNWRQTWVINLMCPKHQSCKWHTGIPETCLPSLRKCLPSQKMSAAFINFALNVEWLTLLSEICYRLHFHLATKLSPSNDKWHHWQSSFLIWKVTASEKSRRVLDDRE